MGEVSSTWTVDIRRLEVFEDWQVDIRSTSMDSPIATVDDVAKANIATIKGVPIANMQSMDGITMRNYRWQVTITA